jgi:ParB-like chromosome segregation protein Spo0J
MTGVALGFIPEPLSVPLSAILPSRRLPAAVSDSKNFRRIKSSIEEVGLIEPLSVTPADKASGQHVLLDGHFRLLVMQNLGFAEAECLVATDDETYTYNNRVNRLSTIQQHFMIRRVVDRGVSPERLAKARGSMSRRFSGGFRSSTVSGKKLLTSSRTGSSRLSCRGFCGK